MAGFSKHGDDPLASIEACIFFGLLNCCRESCSSYFGREWFWDSSDGRSVPKLV